MTSTRLSPQRYLDLLAFDGERLAAAAEGHLSEPVPSCPGWDVAEAVRHTGMVYHHKLASMRLGRIPDEHEWAHGPGSPADLFPWYRDALATLLAELASRDPASSAPTWDSNDQTVGFLYRRMAQESVVHRVDVELASDSVTPVPDDLAIDGIDEVLDLFLRYGLGTDPDEDVEVFDGRSVQIRCGDAAWHVSGRAGAADGQIGFAREVRPADASVSGEPADLLLWLWNRRPDSAVQISGDAEAIALLQGLLAYATE